MIKQLYILFICLPIFLIGQNTDSLHITQTTLLGDRKVEVLHERYIKLNKEKGVMGWRLQIYSDTEREKAQEVRIKFLQNFPEVKAYMSHKSPYFKVVIGNFYTKLQAKKVQNEIQSKYNCYIVPSEIELITD
jgi:hypothetical protein|tara:strand:+ start:1190 stop:1588 length:399 start_codon:yes stop_codon:yes gene_type:complete